MRLCLIWGGGAIRGAAELEQGGNQGSHLFELQAAAGNRGADALPDILMSGIWEKDQKINVVRLLNTIPAIDRHRSQFSACKLYIWFLWHCDFHVNLGEAWLWFEGTEGRRDASSRGNLAFEHFSTGVGLVSWKFNAGREAKKGVARQNQTNQHFKVHITVLWGFKDYI